MVNDNADILKAAGVFVDNKGRLLISKDKGSTKWQMLGGRIEKGETRIECLKREIKEELDSKIEVDLKMYKDCPVFPAANDPGKTVKLYFYFCKLLTKPKLIENVEFLHWLTKEEAESGKFEFSEAVKNFLLPELIKDKILL